MLRLTFLIPLMLIAGCEVTDEIGIDFYAKETINYREVGKKTISVDGKEYKLTEVEGYDKKTNELVIRIFEGHHRSGSFECVGSLEACRDKIKKLNEDKVRGD